MWEDKNVLTWYADQKADEYQIRVTDGEYTYRYIIMQASQRPVIRPQST